MAATQPSSDHASPTPILATDKCVIRIWSPSDAQSLANVADDPEVTRFLRDRFPRPYTLAVANSWIERCLAENSRTSGLHFAICALSGEVVGAIGLEEPQPDVNRRTRELGYYLGRQHWGKGIAKSAVWAFVRWAFAELPDMLRIEASVVEGNDASQAVLCSAGFVKEGVRRCAVFRDGKVLDDNILGLTRQDIEG